MDDVVDVGHVCHPSLFGQFPMTCTEACFTDANEAISLPRAGSLTSAARRAGKVRLCVLHSAAILDASGMVLWMSCSLLFGLPS